MDNSQKTTFRPMNTININNDLENVNVKWYNIGKNWKVWDYLWVNVITVCYRDDLEAIEMPIYSMNKIYNNEEY